MSARDDTLLMEILRRVQSNTRCLLSTLSHRQAALTLRAALLGFNSLVLLSIWFRGIYIGTYTIQLYNTTAVRSVNTG